MDNKNQSPKKLHRQGTAVTGDDLFNAKASSKGNKRPQTQQVSVRPRSTFMTEIERSQHIKERTHELYMQRFAGKLDSNNKIIPTELPSNVYHGTRRNFSVNIDFNGTLKSLEHGQLTEEDSYVPNAHARQVSAFPVGDTKLFPPRRPHTGAWKVGLRQYEHPDIHISSHASVATKDSDLGMGDNDSQDDNNSVKSFGSVSSVSKAATGSQKALSKLKRQASEDSLKLRPQGSAAKLNTFLAAQYATEQLPKLTHEQKKKYFGTSGTENFYQTYRELKSRGEVLLDGYADLERLVAKPAEKNVMLRAMDELQEMGVLTPRMKRPDDDKSDDGSRSLSPMDKGNMTPLGIDLTSMRPTHHFSHPTVLTNPKVTGMVNSDGIHVSEQTLNVVVEALHESAFLHHDAERAHTSARAADLDGTEEPAPLTAAEIAAENARLEKVAKERHAEMSKHGSFVAVDKKPALKRHKTSADMQAVVKAGRLDTMPVLHHQRSVKGDKGTNSTLPAIKGVTPAEAKDGRTPKTGAGRGASTKAGGKRPDSREKSGATSPISPLEMGEIVRTFSDDLAINGGGGGGIAVGGGGGAGDLSDSEDAEDQSHSDQIFFSQPFSSKQLPSHVTGQPEVKATIRLDMGDIPRSRLDDPSPDDPGMYTSYAPASPRAIFLSGCLNGSIPPVTVALIRKKISATINLAHMGLGTKIARVLAPCLSSLPHLQLLNLSDNNLDDLGLSLLIRAIAQHRNIEILDISQNTIGSDAAEALAEFLGHKDCRLQCLRMSNANIDDGECANFVEVLMSNHHLKELDMSNNLLGKDENLNAVQPDFVTGGESLSELLSNPQCPLRTLNLHWNMIRLEGAEVLCNSLRHNKVLTNLDLSYNALGSKAAGVLGAALMENHVLLELNVANNGIDEFGCFTLMAGLRENTSLRNLVLDGNPLGVQGGRILIKVATLLGHRLTMSAMNCDFNIHNSNFVFNINEPYGEFMLDLSVPYERAIMLEILNICEIDGTIEFNKLEYSESGSDAGFVPLKLVRFDTVVMEHTRQETRELRDLAAMEKLSKYTWDEIFHAAQRYCTLDPEVLVKADIERLLKELKIMDIPTVVSEVFFTLDPMDFGWVDLHEFVTYVIKRAKIATERIYDLNHITRLALSTSPTVRYIPPAVGRIRIRTTEGFGCNEDAGTFKPISNSQCRQVLKSAENSSNPLGLIIFAIEASRMRIEEAKLMYKQVLSKTEDAIMVIAVILQRMRSTEEALRVLKHFIGADVLRWRRLKQRLGTSLLPLIGIYSGYYHLDLTFPTDRVCLKKLIERSVLNCDDRLRRKLGDTSQNGTWSCFRNEYHPDNPEARIIPKYFYPLPEKAKVEFDFINIARPDLTINRAVGDDVIVDMVLMARLLDEDKVDWALARLAEMGAGLRKSCLSNGRPLWKTEIGRAMAVNDLVYGYYSALPARKKSLLKSQKREATTKQVLTREQSMKKTKVEGSGHKNMRTSMMEKEKERQREALERQQKAALENKKSVNIEAFRSFNLKGKDHQMKAFWSKRLFEVMYESNGTDELKSAAVLEFFEIMMSTWWVYCRHLALILELFHIGCVAKSTMGSYRVELVIMLFDHVLDLHNFEVVMMVLTAEEQACLYARIGILNLFNPCKPEGGWQLDLMRYEERQVAKMLIHLSVQEPGDNWSEPQFIFDHGFLPVPGWSLSVVWLQESGLPNKGILSLEFFSGNGINSQNCLVDRRLRAMLCSLVLPSQRDLQQEFRINKQELFSLGNAHHGEMSIKINFNANLKKKQTKAHMSLAALNELDTQAAAATETESADDGASVTAKIKPTAFFRPHALATMFSLHKQAPKLSMLYWDEKQGKVMLPYTYKDANAHLRTVNVEWTYGDYEGKQQDSWHM